MRFKLALIAALISMPLLGSGAQAYDPFCTSLDRPCGYVGPNPPVLNKNICWSSATGALTLKGTAACPSGSAPFFAVYGEKIRTKLYIYITNACSLGLCLPFDSNSGPFESEALCCDGNENCTEVNGYCPHDIVFCEAAATNEDGTISCYDDEQ